MRESGKPTVVAINDKQPSALLFALSEARSSSSSLRVVSAHGVPPQASTLNDVDGAIIDELRGFAQGVLDDARQFIEEQEQVPEVEYVLSPLPPVEALMHEADHARAIVVGADDVPWIERLLRTRIAGYVAKHASCPVFVVPELEFPTGPAGEVIVAIHSTSTSAGPLLVAFEEANARGLLLRVLHATPPGTLAVDAEASRSDLHEALSSWREQYPDVMVIESDSVGDPREAVSRATYSAELVIVGRPQSHGLPFALARPVAVKVLKEARCPIAVVPVDYRG